MAVRGSRRDQACEGLQMGAREGRLHQAPDGGRGLLAVRGSRWGHGTVDCERLQMGAREG